MVQESPLPGNLNPADLPALKQAVLRVIIRRARVSASALEKIVDGAPGEVRAAAERLTNAHWMDTERRGDEVIFIQRAPRSSVTETGAFKPGDFFTVEKLRAARATYEDSLFSWRIRRRQRAKDLLEKINL